jgi:hypothetical protein
MIADAWEWWMQSDAGLATRIAMGTAVLATLAIVDWRAKGKDARRWREYLFLLAATAAAMAYGVINNQITVTISWEYFYLHEGKYADLQSSLGWGGVRWQAFLIGLKATWTAGLLLGVALLFANNPRKRRPQLPWSRMYRVILWPTAGAAGLGALLGLAGWLGLLTRIGGFELYVEHDLWRPSHLMCVWGMHLGASAGGVIGAAVGVWRILRERAAKARGMAGGMNRTVAGGP